MRVLCWLSEKESIMSELNIAVCVKPVPDAAYYDKIMIDPVTKTLVRSGIPMVINPLDKHAIELALSLKEKVGGKVTIFAMAPESTKNVLADALAMGADEIYLISDRVFAGADTLATSYTLSEAIKTSGPHDLVITGNESADGGTAHVSSQLGEWLEIPHLMNVLDFEYYGNAACVKTKIECGLMEYHVVLPAVISVTHEINKPRLISVMGMLKAKSKPVYIVRASDLELDEAYLGLKGSPTQPGDINLPDMSRKAIILNGESDDIAEKIMAIIRKTGVC